MAYAFERAKNEITSRIHTAVELYTSDAQTKAANRCRIDAAEIAAASGISDRIWDLIEVCDDEARRWMKMLVDEWAK
ncbi:MAG: hypothetical protein K6T73_11505 [Candidatus Bathyarchaeota archaeon]|nr:hypothetical protein [Candidatus Bathyarchaeota archaeon]